VPTRHSGVTAELGGGNKETRAQASIHSDEEIIAPNTDSDVALECPAPTEQQQQLFTKPDKITLSSTLLWLKKKNALPSNVVTYIAGVHYWVLTCTVLYKLQKTYLLVDSLIWMIKFAIKDLQGCSKSPSLSRLCSINSKKFKTRKFCIICIIINCG